MVLLLDTHTFLWFVQGDAKLSKAARNLIEDVANVRWLSMASLWEMAIKVSIGRLTLAQPFESLIPEQLQQAGVSLLPIHDKHVYHVATLPLHRKDPFDRLIISQSLVEQIPIISADPLFDKYGAQRLW